MKKILNIVLFIILLMFFHSGCDSSKKGLQKKKTETTQKTELVQLQKSESKPIKRTENNNKMTYDKIMRRLSDTFLMEYNPLLDGTSRYIGQTSDNGVQIELIGTKSNITEATLTVFLSQSDYLATKRTAISIIFLNDAVPGISADWFEKTTLEASDKLNRGLNPNKTEYIGYRKIEFKVESLLGCFVITVK